MSALPDASGNAPTCVVMPGITTGFEFVYAPVLMMTEIADKLLDAVSEGTPTPAPLNTFKLG
jgi:hypothetical protein